jgi:uncharacterized protein
VKLHASVPARAHTVTAYGDDYVMIDGVRHEKSIVVTPERITDWPPQAFTRLRKEDFESLLALGADIVLLGTGPKQRFPHPSLTAALAEARVGLEVMDAKAACRTYNILVAEERKVALALLFE